MDKKKQNGSNFFEALNSIDFRAELADAFGFPAMKKVDCDDDIDNFISELEKCIKEKKFSLTRLEHEFSFAQKLLDRAESRYERNLSKLTNLLGFSATILTFMLTYFLTFHERLMVGKGVFVFEFIGIAIIAYVILRLIILIYPSQGYEFKNIFKNEVEESEDVEEKALLLQNAIANFRIAAGIRDRMSHRTALAIQGISKKIGFSLIMLLTAFSLNNMSTFQKIMECLFCLPCQ